MVDSRTFMKAVPFTLFSLAILGFFIGGGLFAANVDPPNALEFVGGFCFFFWWMPILIASFLHPLLQRMNATRAISAAGITGCSLLIAGGILLFLAALLLASGPVRPLAQMIGHVCLAIWWVPALSGAACVMICLILGLRGPNIGG